MAHGWLTGCFILSIRLHPTEKIGRLERDIRIIVGLAFVTGLVFMFPLIWMKLGSRNETLLYNLTASAYLIGVTGFVALAIYRP